MNITDMAYLYTAISHVCWPYMGMTIICHTFSLQIVHSQLYSSKSIFDVVGCITSDI